MLKKEKKLLPDLLELPFLVVKRTDLRKGRKGKRRRKLDIEVISINTKEKNDCREWKKERKREEIGNLSSPQPPGDTMEMKCVIAISPRDCTFLLSIKKKRERRK